MCVLFICVFLWEIECTHCKRKDAWEFLGSSFSHRAHRVNRAFLRTFRAHRGPSAYREHRDLTPNPSPNGEGSSMWGYPFWPADRRRIHTNHTEDIQGYLGDHSPLHSERGWGWGFCWVLGDGCWVLIGTWIIITSYQAKHPPSRCIAFPVIGLIISNKSGCYEQHLRTCPFCSLNMPFLGQEKHVLERRRACSCCKFGLFSNVEGNSLWNILTFPVCMVSILSLTENLSFSHRRTQENRTHKGPQRH